MTMRFSVGSRSNLRHVEAGIGKDSPRTGGARFLTLDTVSRSNVEPYIRPSRYPQYHIFGVFPSMAYLCSSSDSSTLSSRTINIRNDTRLGFSHSVVDLFIYRKGGIWARQRNAFISFRHNFQGLNLVLSLLVHLYGLFF